MTPFRLQVAELVRPISLWMPRGYRVVYDKLLGKYKDYISDTELKTKLKYRRHKVFYDRYLKANIYVDIGDWACRGHYYKGVYYDRTVPLLVDRLLGNGGTFIDVGANRGLHTVYAANVLSNQGMVYAFEPHPVTYDILKAHLSINAITNCMPFNIGVSNNKGTLKLNMFEDQHSGTCSFVNSGEIFESISVPIQTLDDAMAGKALPGPLLVKIDVEGFEYNVLLGMKEILSKPNVTIICEVTNDWLVRAGATAADLFKLLKSYGFSAYLPRISHHNLICEKLDLIPIPDIPSERQYDAVFMR